MPLREHYNWWLNKPDCRKTLTAMSNLREKSPKNTYYYVYALQSINAKMFASMAIIIYKGKKEGAKMISRKTINTVLLFVFCIGLLASITLWVGVVPFQSRYVGLTSPGTNYPPGKEIQPCVGWNAFNWGLPPDPDAPNVGWNSFSWVLPSQDEPQVGWNSYSFVLPPDKEPVFHPEVGWNS